MGFTVYVVMVALGEMGAWLPHKKSFSGYATRFVDPAFGFATGWNYFFKYVIVLPNNLTATGILLQRWLPNINVSVWITVFGVAIICLNVGSLSLTISPCAAQAGADKLSHSSSTLDSSARPSSGCRSSRRSSS